MCIVSKGGWQLITTLIVAIDGGAVFSQFDLRFSQFYRKLSNFDLSRTLIALLTRAPPKNLCLAPFQPTSIGNGFLSRDLADIVIGPFVTARCCHTELNGSVTLWLYGRISDCQLLKTWTLWFTCLETHIYQIEPCLPWYIENTFRYEMVTIRNYQMYSACIATAGLYNNTKNTKHELVTFRNCPGLCPAILPKII